MKIVGQAVPHESARGHVTGEALYTDDLLTRFPNLLHAWPVLAPHAHARLTKLDVTPALAELGVRATLTASDVPGEGDSGCARHDEPLFPTEIVFHSQPVAWILGETLEAARRGAARSSLTTSPHRIEGELAIGGQEHFYLETQSSIAWLDESGGVMVESSTQHPSETQEIVARALGLARNKVTVGCLRMGGAFGGKEVQANPYAAIAALGAWKTRRPVRMRLPRVLDMVLTGKRHPFLARFTAGFDNDGRILGLKLALYSDGGWSLDLSEPVMARALFHCDN